MAQMQVTDSRLYWIAVQFCYHGLVFASLRTKLPSLGDRPNDESPSCVEDFMRALLFIVFLSLAGSLSAVVPLDTVKWTKDSPVPSEAGIAHRVQSYFLVDFSEDAGRGKYGGLRDFARDTKLATTFQVVHILVVANGQIDPLAEGDKKEFWCRGMTSNRGLVRAFGGNTNFVSVLVDGNGRVAKISRIENPSEVTEPIKKLYSTTRPIVTDVSQFPLSFKVPLEALCSGDINRAMRSLSRAGADAPVFVKTVTDQVNRFIETDTALLTNPATLAADKMIAVKRLNGILAEFPKSAAAPAAKTALKKTKDDKQLAKEQQAYDMLMQYFSAMERVSTKKIKDVQREWLPGITAKYGGTYAAEVATMIRHASMLDEE